MLTLTRKIGQKILIGNDIEIVVREIRGRQVRLGIIAPAGIPVYREELYRQVANEDTDTPQSATLDEAEDVPELPAAPEKSDSEPNE